ncbi:MAG: DUF4332 domain-containing protein [Roseimicrobium sp.]
MTALVPTLQPPYTELLRASGVRDTYELARNHPGKLLRWMEEVNHDQRLVRKLPSLDMVCDWVRAAQATCQQAA